VPGDGPTARLRWDRGCARRTRVRFGLGLAGARPGAAPLPARRRSLCGRPAPRDRHRRSCGHIGARAGGRACLLRRDRSGGRPDGLDPNGRRLLGHAPPSRLDRGAARGGGGGGRLRRHRRSQRRGGVAGALPLPRRSAELRAERVPGSAPVSPRCRGPADRAGDRRGAQSCGCAATCACPRAAAGGCPGARAGASRGEDEAADCLCCSCRRGRADRFAGLAGGGAAESRAPWARVGIGPRPRRTGGTRPTAHAPACAWGTGSTATARVARAGEPSAVRGQCGTAWMDLWPGDRAACSERRREWRLLDRADFRGVRIVGARARPRRVPPRAALGCSRRGEPEAGSYH
jgi:hypothetical protein